jgi:hypothetical protein
VTTLLIRSWGLLLMFVLIFVLGLEQVLGDDRPTNPGFNLRTLEILSYQDQNYKFKIIGPNEELPLGFEQPGFDETGFDTGNAAFGGGGGGAGVDCPLRSTAQTEWPLESQLLVRRVVSIPDGANNIRIMVSFDNDLVGVFFNGTQLNTETIIHPNCPILDEFRFDVPQELVQPGQNLVVFRVLDRPPDVGQANESFFDARMP